MACLLAALVLLAGCAQPLRVGMSGDYPPFAWRDAKGCLRGYDVDLAQAWARHEERAMEAVTFRWPELATRLEAGDFDVVMSGVTVRGDRLVLAPMTRATAASTAIVVVRQSEDKGRVHAPGARIAVNRGGHLEKVARASLPQAELLLVDDNRSLPTLLRDRGIDGVVTDSRELASFEPPPTVASVLRRDRKAFWVAADNPELADRLDQWLAALEASGELARVQQRHFGADEPDSLSAHDAHLADLLARRLQLMPLVAEVKSERGLPIDAPQREAQIEERAAAAAGKAGLERASYLRFVRAQFRAAKAVQRAHLDEARGTLVVVDLNEQIRPAIDRIDRALRAALAQARPEAEPQVLAARVRALAPVAGLDVATSEDLTSALVGVEAASRRP